MAKAATNRAYDPSQNQYPRVLYKGDDAIVVANEEEEEAKVANGWGRDRPPQRRGGAASMPNIPVPANLDPAVADRVASLADQVAALSDTVVKLGEAFNAIDKRLVALEAADAGKSGKSGK